MPIRDELRNGPNSMKKRVSTVLARPCSALRTATGVYLFYIPILVVSVFIYVAQANFVSVLHKVIFMIFK